DSNLLAICKTKPIDDYSSELYSVEFEVYSIDCVIVNDMSSCVVKSREWKLSNQPLLSFTINQPIPHPYRFVCYSDERHSSINFCVGVDDWQEREEEFGMVYCYSVGVSLVR